LVYEIHSPKPSRGSGRKVIAVTPYPISTSASAADRPHSHAAVSRLPHPIERTPRRVGRGGRTRPRPKSRRAHQLAPSRPTRAPPTELGPLQSLRQHQARRTLPRRSRGGNWQAD
jgi:hypothetical protein